MRYLGSVESVPKGKPALPYEENGGRIRLTPGSGCSPRKEGSPPSTSWAKAPSKLRSSYGAMAAQAFYLRASQAHSPFGQRPVPD